MTGQFHITPVVSRAQGARIAAPRPRAAPILSIGAALCVVALIAWLNVFAGALALAALLAAVRGLWLEFH